MIYNSLAKYYDALLLDADAFDMWYDFYLKHYQPNKTLELASGTGEISLRIAKTSEIDVSDVSDAMLDELKTKDQAKVINNYLNLDLNALEINDKYDNIICFCDSINYILDYKTLKSAFKAIYNALNDNGVFMFDMHTETRLEEFKDGYIEVGRVLDTDYQWSINSDEAYINYHFVFYEDNPIFEYHTQRVFNLSKVVKMLEDLDFKVVVYTDFTTKGQAIGEKYFLVGSKA